MVRKICTMLALSALFALASFALVGCERVEASGDKAGITKHQTAPAVQVRGDAIFSVERIAPSPAEHAVLSVKNSTPKSAAAYRRVEVIYVGNSVSCPVRVRQKPKTTEFNGVGHDHFARADI